MSERDCKRLNPLDGIIQQLQRIQGIALRSDRKDLIDACTKACDSWDAFVDDWAFMCALYSHIAATIDNEDRHKLENIKKAARDAYEAYEYGEETIEGGKE